MEMRPVAVGESGLANPKDMIFEASSLPGHSVVLQDGGTTARAGRLWYETTTQKAQLGPGPAGTIELADAKSGTLVAQGIMTWLRATGHVVFNGAGRAQMLEGAMPAGGAAAAAEPQKGPTTATWSKSLELTLAPDAQDGEDRPGRGAGGA